MTKPKSTPEKSTTDSPSSKTSVLARFKNQPKRRKIVLLVAAAIIFGALAFSVANPGSSTTEIVEIDQVQDEGRSEEAPSEEAPELEILTGEAIKREDGEGIDIHLLVKKDHDFEEIYANYSRSLDDLDDSAGFIGKPDRRAADEEYEIFTVTIPKENVSKDELYFYQAIGRYEDKLYYGPIVEVVSPI